MHESNQSLATTVMKSVYLLLQGRDTIKPLVRLTARINWNEKSFTDCVWEICPEVNSWGVYHCLNLRWDGAMQYFSLNKSGCLGHPLPFKPPPLSTFPGSRMWVDVLHFWFLSLVSAPWKDRWRHCLSGNIQVCENSCLPSKLAPQTIITYF